MNKNIMFRLSESDYQLLKENMSFAGVKTISRYLRTVIKAHSVKLAKEQEKKLHRYNGLIDSK